MKKSNIYWILGIADMVIAYIALENYSVRAFLFVISMSVIYALYKMLDILTDIHNKISGK